MKVGDKVKVIDGFGDEEAEIEYYENRVGTIIAVNEGNTFPYVVDIPTPDKNFDDTIWAEEELELI